MVKVTVGKAEDPWCEIELTEEDVEETCGVPAKVADGINMAGKSEV